jgi:hypothetical protein
VIVAPRDMLLMIHMANDRHRDHNDGCAKVQLSAFSSLASFRRPSSNDAAAPIAEDHAASVRQLTPRVRLSKKQRLTELFYERDARNSCGGSEGTGVAALVPGPIVGAGPARSEHLIH